MALTPFNIVKTMKTSDFMCTRNLAVIRYECGMPGVVSFDDIIHDDSGSSRVYDI